MVYLYLFFSTQGAIYSLSFSPDGRYLASSGTLTFVLNITCWAPSNQINLREIKPFYRLLVGIIWVQCCVYVKSVPQLVAARVVIKLGSCLRYTFTLSRQPLPQRFLLREAEKPWARGCRQGWLVLIENKSVQLKWQFLKTCLCGGLWMEWTRRDKKLMPVCRSFNRRLSLHQCGSGSLKQN